MQKSSTKMLRLFCISFLLMPLLAFTGAVFEITIDIAPNILNLSNSGTVVTVHTNLPYSSVQSSSLTLDGVQIDSWKADNNGFFVAKFEMNSIKSLSLTVGQYHTFTLSGMTTAGEEFSGVQSILIINKTGK